MTSTLELRAGEHHAGERRLSAVSVRRVASAGWFLLLVGWLHLRFSPLGFNPTDDGYILSQTRRLLSGAVPHRDLISPRPLGSALVHVVDFAVPLPRLEASRLVFVIEITAMSILFAWLVFRRAPWCWGPVQVAGAAASALVNIHVFPLMAWHTVDGLLFLAAGLVVLEHGIDRRGWRRAALVLLGASVLMKQSFVLAPLAGVVRLAWEHRRSARERFLREMLAAGGWAALPGLTYVALVTAAGGLDEMRTQLGGAARGQTWFLIDAFRDGASRDALLRLLAGTVGLLALMTLLDRAFRSVRARPGALASGIQVAQVLSRTCFTVLILHVALDHKLPYGERWGLRLLWALVVLVAARLVLERRFDGAGLALVVAGVSASVSWGYPVPNLVAGCMALLLVHRAWTAMGGLRVGSGRIVRLAALAGACAGFAVTGAVFVDARTHTSYFDVGEAGLTSRLRPVDADFGRVRTNPTTGRFLTEIGQCLDRYPARRVAVLPDGPGLVPVLGLDNPFPVDWMFPPEVVGSEERLVRAAGALDRAGDYLVLFQTFNAFDLRSLGDYPPATPDSPVFFHGSPTGEAIRTRLSGQRIACGGLTGVYDAPGAS